MIAVVLLGGSVLLGFLSFIYVKLNDRCLRRVPIEVTEAKDHKWTTSEIWDTAHRMAEHPVNILDALPRRTGRRYIIVGGAGFVGGWIVVHLLERGEDPRRIRVLDIRAPTRMDLTTGKAVLVDFKLVDISNGDAVRASFAAPWPESVTCSDPQLSNEITVFHTAANIRFYERSHSLIPASARVNINGTQNILDSAREMGVTTFIYTSSGSVSITRPRIWLWPWEWLKKSLPPLMVQKIDDNDALIPLEHHHFFSNYAYTKSIAERMVRSADKSRSGSSTHRKILRTGCIRPGNGIFGPGGDVLCGAYLVRRSTPAWVQHVVQNLVYVENCSLAHLCYEARLNELSDPNNKTMNPDIGGSAFIVTDPCPPPSYGDVYHALTTLTFGRTTFPPMSPTFMLAVSHVVEAFYMSRHFLGAILPFPLSLLSNVVPRVSADLTNLQPPVFSLVMPHLIFSSARASLPPSNGGLGYKGRWTTLEGICKLVTEFEAGGRKSEARQQQGGGISFGAQFGGFGLVKAERGVKKVIREIEKLETASEKLLN